MRFKSRLLDRLRVVSNFGDGDCGAGEIHCLARAKFRGDAFVRARVYFARPTSPKLETTRSKTFRALDLRQRESSCSNVFSLAVFLWTSKFCSCFIYIYVSFYILM